MTRLKLPPCYTCYFTHSRRSIHTCHLISTLVSSIRLLRQTFEQEGEGKKNPTWARLQKKEEKPHWKSCYPLIRKPLEHPNKPLSTKKYRNVILQWLSPLKILKMTLVPLLPDKRSCSSGLGLLSCTNSLSVLLFQSRELVWTSKVPGWQEPRLSAPRPVADTHRLGQVYSLTRTPIPGHTEICMPVVPDITLLCQGKGNRMLLLPFFNWSKGKSLDCGISS